MDKIDASINKLIKKEKVTKTKVTFDIKGLKPGQYTVKDGTHRASHFAKVSWDQDDEDAVSYFKFRRYWKNTKGHRKAFPERYSKCVVESEEVSECFVKSWIEGMDYNSLEIKKV